MPAPVILAVRDTAKGERVAAALTGHSEVRALDLAFWPRCERSPADWTADLDILINNAGIMLVPQGRSTALSRRSGSTTSATSR